MPTSLADLMTLSNVTWVDLMTLSTMPSFMVDLMNLCLLLWVNSKVHLVVLVVKVILCWVILCEVMVLGVVTLCRTDELLVPVALFSECFQVL